MDISIVNFVIMITFGLVLAVLVRSRSPQSHPDGNLLMVILLVCESLHIATIYFEVDASANQATLWVLAPMVFSRLLNGPIIYLYARFILGVQSHFILGDLRHLIPFVVMSLVVYSNRLDFSALNPGDWSSEVSILFSGDNFYPIAVLMFMSVVLVCYSIGSLRIISRHQKNLADLYSDYQSVSLTWLRVLCYLHLMFVMVAPIYFVLAATISNHYAVSISAFGFSFLSTAGLFFLIMVYGFQQPRVFSLGESPEDWPAGQTSNAQDDDIIPAAAPERYVSSAMSEEEAKRFFDLLVEEIESKRIYLQAGLKISDLSDVMGLSVQEISQIINQCSEHNFHDFINHYRVEHAKNLAKDQLSEGKPITAFQMADNSGFQSSSTFYRHFKSQTGLTPKQYLRQLKT